MEITLRVDGTLRRLTIDPRTTVLDALRERGGIMSPKKGCDHGQCGACTVLLDGRRVLSCLMLAIAHDGAEVTTATGVDHRLHEAFEEHDAFQCGYCTPGQICSAAGVLDELAMGWPSHADGAGSRAEVAERMSGNLCRCGAYVNIVRAVLDSARDGARDSAANGAANGASDGAANGTAEGASDGAARSADRARIPEQP
jgi:xanthine dehydrogenase YagT iron-sulfur-binding subunit